MFIFPIIPSGEFEGCLDSAAVMEIPLDSSVGFTGSIETSIKNGSLSLDPGLHFVCDEYGDRLIGMVFTLSDDGQVCRGAPSKAAMPRLTSWPPKKS